MVRRVAGIVLILLGAVAVTLGVLSATSWRTSDEVTATSPAVEVPFVVVEPGVGGIVDRVVKVAVTAADPDQEITVIYGRDVDIDAWLGDLPTQRITGLTDWEVLEVETTGTDGATATGTPTEGSTATVDATEEPPEQTTDGAETAPEEDATAEGGTEGDTPEDGATDPADPTEVPDPVGNDMWLRTEQGTGVLAWTWTVPQDRTQLLIVRDAADGPAPTVAFTWRREVTTPYLLPLVGSGVGTIVVGLGLLISSFVNRPGSRDQTVGSGPSTGVAALAGAAASAVATDPVGAEQAKDEGVASALDGGPPTVETAILTRRQLRELRQTGEQQAVDAIAAGIAPASDAVATDSPEHYPAWLRQEESDGAVATAPAEATESGADAWRRRWGVAAGATEEQSLPSGEDDEAVDHAVGADSDEASHAVVPDEASPAVVPEQEPEQEPADRSTQDEREGEER